MDKRRKKRFDRIEDESRKIGRNILPLTLYQTIQQSPVLFLDIPQQKRLEWLVEQYSHQDFELIREAVLRISKRLGGVNLKAAIEELDKGNLAGCFAYALHYYDDTYRFGISRRDQTLVHRISLPEIHHTHNASIVLDYVQATFKKKSLHP